VSYTCHRDIFIISKEVQGFFRTFYSLRKGNPYIAPRFLKLKPFTR
jgi:hypothetical protein